MKPHHFLLFTAAATDLTSGGGAAVSEPAAPAAAAEPVAEDPAPAAAEPAAAAPEVTKDPGFLESVFAGFKGKSTLISENSALRQRAESAEASLTAANTELTELRGKLTTLEAERTQIQSALTQAKAEAVIVEDAAAGKVAELGFDAAALPAAVKAGETKEELLTELQSTTDNKRRWEIAEKLNSMN